MMEGDVDSEFLRFLRIRHKVVQRLAKEVKCYQEEVKQHEATISRMKAENREPSDIKQQQNVLDETVLMVPDAENRLLRACADLDDYMLCNAVCAAAARSYRAAAAAAPPLGSTPEQQQQRKEEEENAEAGGAAEAAAAAGGSGSQPPGSTSTSTSCSGSAGGAGAGKQDAYSSSTSTTTTPQGQTPQSLSTTQGRQGAAGGGPRTQGKQLNEETYEEVRKIFETLRIIKADLPQLHLSLSGGGGHTVNADATSAAAERGVEEDI